MTEQAAIADKSPAQRLSELALKLVGTVKLPEAAAYETVDLWELLVWVYRDQLAHRLLANNVAWFEWGVAMSGHVEAGRPSVHIDAAIVHAEVLQLPRMLQTLIIEAAEAADQPEYTTQVPRLVPVANADRSRGGARHAVEGEWVSTPMIYLTAQEKEKAKLANAAIRVTRGRQEWCLIVDPRPVKRRRRDIQVEGREQLPPSGHTTGCAVWSAHCPLQLYPHPDYLDHVNRVFDTWHSTMRALAVTLMARPMANHLLAGFDLPPRPGTPGLVVDQSVIDDPLVRV